MWELICHHTYKWKGLPADLSRYNGEAHLDGVDILADGAARGSGALGFPGPQSRVRVPTSHAWKPIFALKVEVTARLNSPSPGSQTLIEGDGSFGLCCHGQMPYAYFLGRSLWLLPGVGADMISTSQDGLEFPGYRLTYGKWATIVVVHNGFDHMRLFVDGAPVTYTRPTFDGIPPVGPKGVSIGNSLAGNAAFGGDIDEIKVWRLDPFAMKRQFTARPVDRETAACWERFLLAIRAALAKHPDCKSLFKEALPAVYERLVRAILQTGPETRERFRKVREEYDRLWRKGDIDGPEMTKLVNDWITWLRLVGFDIQNDPELLSLGHSPCWQLILGELDRFDCDPHYRALLEIIAAALGRQVERRPAAN